MNPITISFIVLSLLYFAAGVYFFGFHWSETALWFRIALPVLFIANVVTAVISGWTSTPPYTYEPLDTENAFQEAQMQYLGKFLAINRNGKRCIVIHASGYRPQLIDALRKGLEGKLDVIASLEFPMATAKQKETTAVVPPATSTAVVPPETPPIGLPRLEPTAPVLEQLLATVGDFDIAILCTPLPEDCISNDGSPKLTRLANREIVFAAGYQPSFANAIERGAILAALTYKKDAKCNEKTCPAELHEAFDARYELLTSLPLPQPPEPALKTTSQTPSK